MSDLTPFTFEGHQLRACPVGDTAEFVAADLAAILNYATAKDMLRGLDEDEKGRQMVPTPGGDQEMLTVTEAGLYQLVLRRQAGYLNDATARGQIKRFQRWVTHVVLPSIRKTGGYGNRELTPQELMARAVIAAQDTIKALEATADTQRARLALVEPKALAFDRWLSSNVDYSVGHVAKALAVAGAQGVGRTRLFVRLAELRWIYRESGQWTPYQAQIDTHRLAVKLGSQLNTRTGEQFSTVTVRITPKGAARLAVLYGVMPETVADALTATEEDEAA